MTHVLLFVPLYPPYGSGCSTHFPNVVDSLSGEHTFIIVTAYHPDKQIITESNGNTIYRVVPFYQSLPNPVRLLVESLTAFAASLYLILFRPVELAHIHATSYASPAVAVAASIANVPIIYACRDLSFPPWITNIGSQPLVFSCGPNVDDILKQEGVPEDRIVRVPIVNPEYVAEYVDEDKSEREQSELSGNFIVTYVGSLTEFKGIEILIKMFAKFSRGKDDVKLQIIGDGPYRPTLVKHISELGLEKHVEIVGEIDHREALQHISCSDVLVHPSARETGPRSVTEAIELGTPVIATPVGIVPEVVVDGHNGLIADRTIEDFSECTTLIYNGQLSQNESSDGQMDKDVMYGWEDVTAVTREMYCVHSED